ncbi:hypothetical protein GCG54_00014002 [Colletotrichum gloeosporioides]|uniref:Chromo domain-containing protein n=1 Tax=Colletotrichum gloeosporioides TaxID=474922 RepID=A0A8H4CEZ1_COLGL|nr:uncharacterized protein GCG54_00014002 [Colletotrichum gloeosporioides]KAF3802768.1 hypothetical protein GCG54_00014002 [Colletotrichum gloeosporioides]
MAQTHYRYRRSAIGSDAFPRRGAKREESSPKRRGSAKIGTTTKQISKKRRAKTAAISSTPTEAKDEEYDDDDRIIGHTSTGNGHSVSLITERAADQSRRNVPEIIVQQTTPSKVYAYWSALGKSREETIGTDHFNVFAILGHDSQSKRLRVQWVGYSDSVQDTSWETVPKIRRLDPALVKDYLATRGLTGSLQQTRKKMGRPQAPKSRAQKGVMEHPISRAGIRDDARYKVALELVGISGRDLRRLTKVILDFDMEERITHRSLMPKDGSRGGGFII